MSARMRPLDLPLSGVRLVEASAGTGKTFTIATLYLRLVLERGLGPARIVVATFTRAATAELAMRLRARLRLAAEILREQDPGRERDGDDGEAEATRAVIAHALADTDAATLAVRARDAELAMDTAVIGTLHGFCNRVLNEFGFETGRAPGELELLEDPRALQQEVVEDFWRSCSTDAEAARLLANTWGTPDALAVQACDPRWRGRHIVAGEDAQLPAEQRRAQREETLAQLDAIRNAIAGWDDDVLQVAMKELADCISHTLARKSRAQGLHALRDWARAGTAADLLSTAARKAVDDLAEGKLADMKSCSRQPQGPVYAAIADLDANIKTLEKLDQAARARLLLDARAYLARELPARMRVLGKLGHDQVVDALAAALHDPQRGAHAVRAIRERWPVALVDESQDTDPQQWRILEKLFAHEDGALVLVGDPKQAIYGFRGGDVHAWLMAKHEAQGEPLRLDESQRSGTGVNAAINALFAGEDAFVEPGIGHEDVHSAPRVAERALLVDGEPSPGLTVWQLPSTGIINKDGSTRAWYKGDAQARIEAACVAQIVDWLEDARRGRVRLREGNGATRELCPRDIAVLVNSNREAKSMQRALSAAGVPAASCLHASIYASDEAADLRLLLEALRNPADAARARAARASLLVGDDALAIARTCSDGAALDALLTETAEWAAHVERRGPLPLLHRLIARAAPRLLAMPGSERRVANYLQLADLLQDDYAACFGIDDLCERYARALRESAGDTDADAVRLRLDTDAQAVQIATVHAAKGLEYGVVLLPCAASGHANLKHGRKPSLAWYHAGDAACVAVGEEIPPEIEVRASREALAEEVRKFYVAVTRARAACVMPWGCVRQADATAAHWLLYAAGREAPLDFDEPACEQALSELTARGDGHVVVSPLPTAGMRRLSRPQSGATQVEAAEFRGNVERDWRTWSFSRLVRGEARGSGADPAPGHGDAGVAAEGESISHVVLPRRAFCYTPFVESETRPAPNILATLAGARFGTAVHAALEHADFDAWRGAGEIPETQRDLIARSLRAQGLPEPGTVSMERAAIQVGECMRGALNVRLACGTCLCDVQTGKRRAEMEFHLRLAPSRVDELFALLHEQGYQQGRTGFGVAHLHGLLTGVMDLVFEHAGRYHLVDYKTNLLPAYDTDALREAVAAHDYDLQYLLYVLALHRWLHRMLPDYDYDTHIGDVHYLFVRDLEGGRGVYCDRPPRALIEAMDAMFEGELEQAA